MLWASVSSSSPSASSSLAICAKIKVPVWPSPVAISLGPSGADARRRLRAAARARDHPRLTLRRRRRLRRSRTSRRDGGRLHAGRTGGYLVGYLLARCWSLAFLIRVLSIKLKRVHSLSSHNLSLLPSSAPVVHVPRSIKSP